jgi:hypothetical protein
MRVSALDDCHAFVDDLLIHRTDRRNDAMRLAMISTSVAVGVLGSLFCVPLRADAQSTVPGTYELRACTEPCDPAVGPSEVVGTLVLAESPFSLERVPSRVRRHLEEFEPWLLAALEDDEPNACFTMSRTRESRQSFLGTSPVGVTKWRVARDTLSVRLWISPDAGYVAQFALDGPTLVGRGYSWTVGERYHVTNELVLLSRRGPPVLDRCFEVAEAVARP